VTPSQPTYRPSTTPSQPTFVPSNQPTRRPTTRPSQPTVVPSLKPSPSPTKTVQSALHAARTKLDSKLVSKYNKPTHLKTNAARKPSFNNYYNYLYHYISPDLRAAARASSAPVQYYSSTVRYAYSPKPSLSNRDFFYYGTSAPTVTHRPTWESLGQFGYGNGSTGKPTNMPLSYYGDFYTTALTSLAPTVTTTGECVCVVLHSDLLMMTSLQPSCTTPSTPALYRDLQCRI